MNDKMKILVVEDEISLAMMMAFLLVRAGYEVEAACNLEKALRLAENIEFDLITLDINIPGASGFEIFRRLKEFPHLKDTPVILVSGGAEPENKRRGFELGAADFIEKPFDVPDFLSRISACLKPQNESRLTWSGKLLETQLD